MSTRMATRAMRLGTALAVCFAATAFVHSGEAAAPETTTPPATFSDTGAGYSFTIPTGYQRLSEEENREVFKNVARVFGGEATEQAQKQPPVWFKGPLDAAHPKALPPSLAISVSALNQPIDPAAVPKYKEAIEASYKKQGVHISEPELRLIKVGGFDALQDQHDLFSPIDNRRDHETVVYVAALGHCYEIRFQYSSSANESVQQALQTVLTSFKAEAPPLLNQNEQRKWSRVLWWTLGSGAVGMLLYVVVSVLAASLKKTKRAEGPA